MASVGCVVERPFEIFAFRKVLEVVVVGPGFRVAGRRQEVAAKSRASGIVSFPWRIQTSAGRGWLDVEGHPTPDSVLFLSEGGARLPGRIRRRHGRSQCV